MANIELVIRLPEEYYKSIMEIPVSQSTADMLIIKSGILLPKRHGRLFILDEAKAKKYFTNFSFSLLDWISEVGISNATIKVIDAN